MTIVRFLEKYPALYEQVYREGFNSGELAERESWEARLLSEDQTGKVLDDIFREAFE